MWLKLILYAIEILGLAWSLFTPSGRASWGWVFNSFVAAAVKEAQPLLDELAPTLGTILTGYVNAFKNFGPAMRDTVGVPIGNLAADNFAAATANLTLGGESTPDNAVGQASLAFQQAFAFGGSSHAITAAFEALFPEKLNVLNGVGPALAEMAGFKEVASQVLDPLYENAFGKALEYYYKSQFKPEFANERDAVRWHSQRLLSDTDLLEVFKYSGLKAKYESAYTTGAYRAVQPRAIASMIQDTPFPTDEMRSLLEFGGYRDQDINLLLQVMQFNSLKNVRGDYLAALLNAAERGAIDTPTLDSDLDGLNFTAEAKNFVHLTVAVKRLVQLEELYRKSVSIGYRTGQVTDAQYVPLLEAAGIGAADAQAHYDIDSEIVRGKALLAAEREALKEQEKLAALAVATTRELYLKGSIDGAAMAAAIATSNIPALLIPSTVGLITAQGLARKVNVYGLLLDPPAAALLKEKVAAVKEQVLKKILTLAAAAATLDSFNLPPANRDALLSEWAAQALKVVLPV